MTFLASALSLAAVVLVTLAVWQVVHGHSMGLIRAQLRQSAQLAARALQTEIDRFSYLPSVAAEDGRIGEALSHPADEDRILNAKEYLERVANSSGAAVLYLLDETGLTLASSNWRTEDDFTGSRYDFRPYYRDAIRTGSGRFYAIGVTTGKPGYFLSRRIDLASGITGVMVVKIDLLPLEAAWLDTQAGISVADREGVVFLTGNPDWRYRPVLPLDDTALDRLSAARTYDGVNLRAGLSIISSNPRSSVQDQSGEFLFFDGGDIATRRALHGEGWTLYANRDTGAARAAAATWALASALACLLLTGALHFAIQRQQLISLRLRQGELLECKVEERTRDLEQEIEVRRNAEEELRRAQEGLIQSEKMAALGRMSAAIAHEVSQPLAALETTLASARLLASDSSDKGVTLRLEKARSLVKRMQRTIMHLRQFSRRDGAERKMVNCRTCVSNALEIAGARFKAAGVTPRLRAAGDVFVQGVEVRLEQVILNLLLNAIDAAADVDNPSIDIWVALEDDLASITIQDNGSGIDPTRLEQVKEPFYSTKLNGEGMGLGLSISTAIVENHGGELRITSDGRSGTRATILLPAAGIAEAAAE
ncbi:MAG: ATP-binding protein [Oricola sp.]